MISLKTYSPHKGQQAFHYAIDKLYRFLAMVCGIRGGKTYAGAREGTRQAWNSQADETAVYGIIAPTYHMLDRPTWQEFKYAARPLIASCKDSKKRLCLRTAGSFTDSAQRSRTE